MSGPCSGTDPKQTLTDTVSLTPEALGALMPMYVAISAQGQVTGCGPVLARLLAAQSPLGQDFFAHFEIRRPHGITCIATLGARAGSQLYVNARAIAPIQMRGTVMPRAGGGWLLNLSFGINIIDAVRHHGLTAADFAATDLAVELLYVVEAKTLIMNELRDLNLRLQGAHAAAEEQALTDTLTGLRNRRALDMALARLTAEGMPFALMHIDLDYFKAVNDSFGHAAGDHVLREVARVLRTETRPEDTVARIGGDEFVLLLPGLTDSGVMQLIARRIIHRLSLPIPYDDQECRISASVGFALSVSYDQPDVAVMLEDADQALYAAKRAGRATVRASSDGGPQAATGTS